MAWWRIILHVMFACSVYAPLAFTLTPFNSNRSYPTHWLFAFAYLCSLSFYTDRYHSNSTLTLRAWWIVHTVLRWGCSVAALWLCFSEGQVNGFHWRCAKANKRMIHRPVFWSLFLISVVLMPLTSWLPLPKTLTHLWIVCVIESSAS